MSMGPARRSANLVLLMLVSFAVIAGIFVVVGLLGMFLLPFALVALFLIAISLSGGGLSGPQLIGGILIFFTLGLGLHFVLGSTIGYDPAQTGYMSAVALDSVNMGVSDSTFSLILGFVVIAVIVALAFTGFFMQAKHRR